MSENKNKHKGRWVIPVIIAVLVIAGAAVWGWFNVSYVYNSNEDMSYAGRMNAMLGYRMSPRSGGYAVCVERYDKGVKTICEWPEIWAGPDNGSKGDMELSWYSVTNEPKEGNYLFTYLLSITNSAVKTIPPKSLMAAESKGAFFGRTIKGKSFSLITEKRGCVIGLAALGDTGTIEILPEELEKLERKGDDKAVKEYLSKNEITFVIRLYPYSYYENPEREKDIFSDEVRDSFFGIDKNGVYVYEEPLEPEENGADDKPAEQPEEKPETGEHSSMSDEDMSAMMALFAMSMGETEPVGELELPADSDELSITLAKQALTLCTGHTKLGQAQLLMDAGFSVILQRGYDKPNEDESHTCAYTIARKRIIFGGSERMLIYVAVRGTNAGEWFSNFNYAPSQDDNTEFAENFLQSAEEIYVNLIPSLIEYPDALILVSGHSRGAAAANLLGMTLDDLRGSSGVYVYTFATPNTYRGSEKDGVYGNIFNFINPSDVVTEVPLKGLGYHHIGTDIVLPGDPESIQRIAAAMQTMYETAPSISQYYSERHSLTGPGKDNNGYTAYEIMQALASSMTGVKSASNGGLNLSDVYAITDSSANSADSDLAPLLTQLEKIIGRDGSFGSTIFAQHMPMSYSALIDVYAQYAVSGYGDLSSYGDLSGYGDLSSYGDLSGYGDPANNN